jgi:hypothetical protein
MNSESTGFGRVVDLIAAVITVITLISSVVITTLDANHITRIAKDQEGLIIALIALGVSGLIATVYGVTIRHDHFLADQKARAGTYSLCLGAILLLMALAGVLTLSRIGK